MKSPRTKTVPPKSEYGYVIVSLDSDDMKVPHYNTLKEAKKDFADWGCDAVLLRLAPLHPPASSIARLERAVVKAAMRCYPICKDGVLPSKLWNAVADLDDARRRVKGRKS